MPISPALAAHFEGDPGMIESEAKAFVLKLLEAGLVVQESAQ